MNKEHFAADELQGAINFFAALERIFASVKSRKNTEA